MSPCNLDQFRVRGAGPSRGSARPPGHACVRACHLRSAPAGPGRYELLRRLVARCGPESLPPLRISCTRGERGAGSGRAPGGLRTKSRGRLRQSLARATADRSPRQHRKRGQAGAAPAASRPSFRVVGARRLRPRGVRSCGEQRMPGAAANLGKARDSGGSIKKAL